MSEHGAASFIKRRWGAWLTWTVERAHALNVYSALLSFYYSDWVLRGFPLALLELYLR